MPSLRTALRWTLLVFFGVLVAPVVSEFPIRWAEKKGLYDNAEGFLVWALALPRVITSLPGFWTLFASVGALTAGLWLDLMLRRKEERRVIDLRFLGSEMKLFSGTLAGFVDDQMETRRDDPFRESAKLESYLETLKRHGIKRLDKLDGYDKWAKYTLLGRYFHFVGTFLADGHPRKANAWTRDFNKKLRTGFSKEAFNSVLKAWREEGT